MKTLLKQSLLLFGVFCMLSTLSAQKTHEISISAGQQIVVQQLLGKITIKESSGSILLIEASGIQDLPEKAKGLKEIYGGGMDNTGIGLNITESGKMILISGATKRSEEATYILNVPASASLKIDYTSPFGYDDIEVQGFAGELEVKMLNAGINLNNVTGPLTIHTINGDINIDFKTLNQKSPTSITSINGEVEVTLPSVTPVNLKLSAMHGEIYSDCDIKFEKKSEPKDNEWTMIGGNLNSNGSMNGGGVELSISSINGSIYLRKK